MPGRPSSPKPRGRMFSKGLLSERCRTWLSKGQAKDSMMGVTAGFAGCCGKMQPGDVVPFELPVRSHVVGPQFEPGSLALTGSWRGKTPDEGIDPLSGRWR